MHWSELRTAQFWVDVATAFGTVGAVVVALFGPFRAKLFPPKLRLTLADPDSEKTKVRVVWTENNVPKERLEDAWYYCLSISNARRWSPANQVQVCLISVEEPKPEGQFGVSWVGNLPLTWKGQDVGPLLRTIDPTSEVVLCSITKGKWLQLHTVQDPPNFEKTRKESAKLILSVQAKSNECDSPILRVNVAWDGKWNDGTQEMRHHLVFKVDDVVF